MDAAVGCFALAQSAPPLLGILPVSSDGQLQMMINRIATGKCFPRSTHKATSIIYSRASMARSGHKFRSWLVGIAVETGLGRFRLLHVASAKDRGQPRLALCHGAVGSHQGSSTRWSRLIATVLAGMMMDRLALSISVGQLGYLSD
jgi:hypothetical protein